MLFWRFPSRTLDCSEMINGFIVEADRCVFILLLMLVGRWAVKLQMMQTYSGEDFSKTNYI